MFDIGWSEILVIAVIAIVVVGPRDLPRMMRNVGRYVGKAKTMAREFQTQFDDAVRDTEFEDVRKSISDLTSANPANSIKSALDPFTSAAQDLQKAVEKSDTDAPPTPAPGTEQAGAPAKAAKQAKSATPAKPARARAVKKPAPVKPVKKAGGARGKNKKPTGRKSSAKPAKAKPAKAKSTA